MATRASVFQLAPGILRLAAMFTVLAFRIAQLFLGLVDALLHLVEFDFQDLAEFAHAKGMKHDSLINPVHELRSEFAASSFHTRP